MQTSGGISFDPCGLSGFSRSRLKVGNAREGVGIESATAGENSLLKIEGGEQGRLNAVMAGLDYELE